MGYDLLSTLHFHSTARVPPIRKDGWPPFCVIKLISQQASAQFDVAVAVMRHSFHPSIESAVQCGMEPDDHISRVPLVCFEKCQSLRSADQDVYQDGCIAGVANLGPQAA